MSAVLLTREVEVTAIPSGEKLPLPADTEVAVTQALGGSFTLIVPSHAGLYRLEGKDADAIGRDVPAEANLEIPADLEEAVWTTLRSCYDPEIPVNMVDLGLIYSIAFTDAETGGKNVKVEMTLTAPGCGMGPVLAAEARQKILGLEGVSDATVDVVWDPPWTPDRISAAGKQKLGIPI